MNARGHIAYAAKVFVPLADYSDARFPQSLTTIPY